MKKKTIRGAILSLVLTLGLSTAAFADGMGNMDMGQSNKEQTDMSSMDNGQTDKNNMDMGQGTQKSINDIKAELNFNKDNKAKTGKNDVIVILHDNNNKEIDNATVNISAEMDKNSDMGGMNMDNSKPTEVALESSGNGQYMGNIDFSDKGKWTVTANVMVNGEKKDIKFDVDVVSAGPNWVVIGGFIGIVAVIIIVAAVKKKQSSK